MNDPICPRCGQDWVVPALIKPLNESIQICPECDSFWPAGEKVLLETAADYGTYMESQRLPITWGQLDVPPNIDGLEATVKIMISSGKDIEDCVAYMRRSKLGKIPSMRILMHVTGVSMADAKEIVHFSKAWNDVRERDDEFHRLLEEVLLN